MNLEFETKGTMADGVKKLFQMPTPEELAQLTQEYLNEERRNPNLFSFWYPKVKDCGITMPDSLIIQVPDDMYEYWFGDHGEKDNQAIEKWVTDEVFPVVKEHFGYGTEIFIKNGAFSNKFDYRDCTYRLFTAGGLADHIRNIQSSSLLLDTGGFTELVFREMIRNYCDYVHPWRSVQIYHGLPLVPEFRVFYDFDAHKPMYVVNYWDYDYCSKNMFDATDALAFDAARSYLEKFFEENKDTVMNLVSVNMQDVTGLEGAWSVDVMFDGVTYWLIDMAVGRNSAYWRG